MVNITDINITVHYDNSICNITPDISDQSNSGHPLQLEQDFSIVHHNVNRLYSKLDEIKLYLKIHYSVTIYCCSETSLNDNISDHQITIEGYNIIRRDRNSKEGGGLIIYLGDDTECSRRRDLAHDIVEAVWLEITLKHKKILLAVTYRPPNEHTVSYNTWLNKIMEEAISSAYVEDKSIIILGDFNIDLLGKQPHQEFWLSFIDNYELSQLITNHTRVTPTKKSLLDHIYVSENILVKYFGLLPWALSDHFPVKIVISNSKLADNRGAKHMEISYRKTKQFNEELFCNDIVAAMLVDSPSKFCEIENDVNIVVNLWTKYFNEINNRHCPTITKRIKHNPSGSPLKYLI